MIATHLTDTKCEFKYILSFMVRVKIYDCDKRFIFQRFCERRGDNMSKKWHEKAAEAYEFKVDPPNSCIQRNSASKNASDWSSQYKCLKFYYL